VERLEDLLLEPVVMEGAGEMKGEDEEEEIWNRAASKEVSAATLPDFWASIDMLVTLPKSLASFDKRPLHHGTSHKSSPRAAGLDIALSAHRRLAILDGQGESLRVEVQEFRARCLEAFIKIEEARG
jgi:hypothetical protein